MTRPTSRRSCCVVYANILGLNKNLSYFSLIASGGDVFLYSETLVSFRRHISKLMVPGFDGRMQLLRGKVDRFRGLAVYVCDGFSAYNQHSYECGCCDVIVDRICSTSHNFYVFGVYRNLDLLNIFFCFVDVYG